MDIFISGSLAYDRIMDFPGKFSDHILPDKIHILNVSFTVNGMVEKFGGTAGNVAYTLSLLEERPLILATIGRDYLEYFEWLKKNNLSAEGIKIISNELTACAYITTDMSDNQITGFNPGSMKHPSEYKFNRSSGQAIGLIAAGNLSDMVEYADAYRKKGIKYICDPGQSLPSWDSQTLISWIRGSNLLISNDYELELIMNMAGMNKGKLLQLTDIIITTLGEKGSDISTAGSEKRIPAARISRVVDPTGAGDAFRAGLLKGMVMGKDMEISAKMGAVAAAYSIENYGTQEHHFTFEEFKARYRADFGEM